MAQLKKPQIKWTLEKIKLLNEQYPLGDKEKLSKDLGISRNTLKYAAKRFGVKSLTTLNKKAFAKLLEKTPSSFYWQGFIMGDGNINEKGRLTITLSCKDLNHLEKLNDFIPGNIKLFSNTNVFSQGDYCCYTCHDIISAKEYLDLYKIQTPKTYNPPNLSCLTDQEKFISFFIGLFDADGCFDLRKNNTVASLKIEIHANWKDTLFYISDKLKEYFNINSSIKYTSRGYIKLLIYKFKYLKILKRASQNLNLPMLKRKWDHIDLNYIPKKNIVEEMLETITLMLKEGKNWKQISSFLGLSINSCRRRYKKLTQI